MSYSNYKTSTPEKAQKSLTITFYGLLLGMVLIVVVFYYLNNNLSNTDVGVLIYITPLIAFALYFLSFYIYKMLLNKTIKLPQLKQKMQQYYKINIIKFALVEVGVMFSAVSFFVTGNIYLFAVGLIGIVYFIFLKPSNQKTVNELNLSHEESQELLGGDFY